MKATLLTTEETCGRISSRLENDFPDVSFLALTLDGRILNSSGKTMMAPFHPDIIWLTVDSFSTKQFETLGKIGIDAPIPPKWVHTFLAGLDNDVFSQLAVRGTLITKNSAQAAPISEYVLANCFALIVPVFQQRQLQSLRKWDKTPYIEIANTSWTLIGYGSISREIISRLKPFGAKISVVRRHLDRERDDSIHFAAISDLPALLSQSDVVVFACALTDETRGIANASFFSAMKPGSILVNVARGGVIDENALRDALDRGAPGKAVLDVFQTEPLPSDNWMWDHPSVLISSHTSNAGNGFFARSDKLFFDNLFRFTTHQPLLNQAPLDYMGTH